MSKYDFEIDLSQNTSTGIILQKIKEGSSVLEFGCAAGRMTRYMKETLGCDVCIVEYDASAFEKAKAYAKEGLCDDIGSFRWFQKFQNITFDVILFADVLEHLAEPEKVLRKAADLLAEDGSVYLSIPNVTHNDIVFKAIQEQFDYTATGILDDTHIHFWGQKNLEELAGKAGLHLRMLEATYCPTGYTEQYGWSGSKISPLVENALKERICGEVYQFVVSLEKNSTGATEYLLKKPAILSHIYLDTGNDFHEEEMLPVESVFIGNALCRSFYVLESVENVRRFRFDPVERQGCILQKLKIRQGEVLLKYFCEGGVEMEQGILFRGPDPKIFVELSGDRQPVIIEAEILLWSETYLEILQASAIHAWEKMVELEGDCQKKEAGYRKQIRGLNQQVQEAQMDVMAYLRVSHSKDRYAMELEKELEDYKNLQVVKIYFGVKRILRALKRRLRRVIGKEEKE